MKEHSDRMIEKAGKPIKSRLEEQYPMRQWLLWLIGRTTGKPDSYVDL